MRRDLIKRTWYEFLTIIDELPKEAKIVEFHSATGPLNDCRIRVMTVGIEDKMKNLADEWGEKLETEEVDNSDLGEYTRLTIRAGAVEVMALIFKEDENGRR